MAERCSAVPQTNGLELPGLLRAFYRDADVRQRMREFLGGTNLHNATAVFIAGTDGYSDYHLQSPPAELPEYLEGALEVDRSLWDRESLIADIDLEYTNFDNPAMPWLDPQYAFEVQQPVLDVTCQVLADFGIDPLILVSGRGFHLLWAVRRNSRAFRRLVASGRIPASLRARYAGPCAPNGASVDLALGYAFSGLGMIAEFIGHRVLAASMEKCKIPIQPAAIEVGPGVHGREIVSFDVSEYGDPLHTRHVRLPFSAYLKPRQLEWALGEAAIRCLLPIFEIPLAGASIEQAIAAMRDPDLVRQIAREVGVAIPNSSEAMNAVFDEYEGSGLAEFHRHFYAGSPREPPSQGPEPQCLKYLFECPNDWLLKPAALQHAVRVLTALGWSAPAIAHRICAAYSQNHSWGDTWLRLDPCNRAIFYARLFSGMIATGLDSLVDFNCVSHQEKGYCIFPECSSNLTLYRDMLLKRSESR